MINRKIWNWVASRHVKLLGMRQYPTLGPGLLSRGKKWENIGGDALKKFSVVKTIQICGIHSMPPSIVMSLLDIHIDFSSFCPSMLLGAVSEDVATLVKGLVPSSLPAVHFLFLAKYGGGGEREAGLPTSLIYGTD